MWVVRSPLVVDERATVYQVLIVPPLRPNIDRRRHLVSGTLYSVETDMPLDEKVLVNRLNRMYDWRMQKLVGYRIDRFSVDVGTKSWSE